MKTRLPANDACLRSQRALTTALGAAALLAASLVASNRSEAATAGDLDTSFGINGFAVTDFGFPDIASSIAIQPNGKIMAAGEALIDSTEEQGDLSAVTLARYHRDGALDFSFGRGGKVLTRVGSGARGDAIALQRDGKIVIATTAIVNRSDDFALLRYLPNGALDPRFGHHGLVTTDFGIDAARALLIQRDGKIVVAGNVGTSTTFIQDFALARYLQNGQLDPTFGHGGLVTTDFDKGSDEAFAIAFDRSGKLIAAGWSIDARGGSTTRERFALARYFSNGKLDRSFGRDGKVTTRLAWDDRVSAVAVQRDGRIVAAGPSAAYMHSFVLALVRYKNNGTLDGSFGTGGIVRNTSIRGALRTPMTLQPDGKIITAGIRDATPDRWVIARYLANGVLDSSFGGDGVVEAGLGIEAMAIQSSTQRLVVAGGSSAGGEFDTNSTLARFFVYPEGACRD